MARNETFAPKRETLAEWAGQAHPPITYDFNPPAISDVFSTDPVCSIPPPQRLFDLASVVTPFAVLFRKSRTTVT